MRKIKGQLITFNISESTAKRISAIGERLYTESRAETLRRCIEIAETVTKVIAEGGCVRMTDKQGVKYRFTLPA